MHACHERGDFAAGAKFMDADIEVVAPDGPEPGAVRRLDLRWPSCGVTS